LQIDILYWGNDALAFIETSTNADHKNKPLIFNKLKYKACKNRASRVHIMCNKRGKTPPI